MYLQLSCCGVPGIDLDVGWLDRKLLFLFFVFVFCFLGTTLL